MIRRIELSVSGVVKTKSGVQMRALIIVMMGKAIRISDTPRQIDDLMGWWEVNGLAHDTFK